MQGEISWLLLLNFGAHYRMCNIITYSISQVWGQARRAPRAKAISSEHRHCLDKQSIPICAAVADAANRPIYMFLRLR